MTSVFRFDVNGTAASIEVEGDTPLLWVLRDTIGLTGTKFGCGVGECGACSVLIDGRAVRSCTRPVAALAGRKITTIEGLAGPVADAVRAAWIGLDVPQCGYCQSGQIVSAVALLERVAAPSDTDIDHALAGNLCRCATYPRIRAAVHRAAASLSAARP